MFQIVNNKVYITRGQSAVYSREIRRNDKYKSPYLIYDACDYDVNGNITTFRIPDILFVIKRNIYSNDVTLKYVGKILDGDFVKTYIVGSVPYEANWLSETLAGRPLTPEIGKRYIVLSKGDYIKMVFSWNGTEYVKEDDYIPVFKSQEILEYKEGEEVLANRLYRFKDDLTDSPYYQYCDVTKGEKPDCWREYSFVINIPISLEDTQNINPGTYYYELSVVYKNEDGSFLYKDVLLDPTEFIIGGTNSEQ